jgi:hypothetical protein
LREMKKLYFVFLGTVCFAPILFYIYLKRDLVCAPRAITASAIFGIVPLLFLTAAVLKKKVLFYYLSLLTLVIEIIITPIIMLKRLGPDKFVNERLLAFFTFEGIAIIQMIIVVLLMMNLLRLKEQAAQ